MKNKILKILFVLTALLGASHALAGFVESVVINEYGQGTWVNASGVTYTFAGTLTDDPSIEGTGEALVYDTNLAFLNGNPATGFSFDMNGDYEIITPNSGGQVAGIVRFFGEHYMIFYDNDDGFGETPADQSGLPSITTPPVASLQQTVVGDPSLLKVLPTEVNGYAGYEDGVERYYTFLSVIPVPEPGVFSLMACGMALLAFRRKKMIVG